MTKYSSLIVWIVSIQVISAFFGWLSQGETKEWYTALARSPFTPPSYLFGIVWPILYAMIATSGWLIWLKDDALKKIFIVQLIQNFLWTVIFFKLHLIGLALLDMLTLALVIGYIIGKTKVRLVKILMWPYLLWILFASHLTLYIWLYN